MNQETRNSILRVICIFSALLSVSNVQAQNLPDSTKRKIDGLFSAYNTTTPGCAIAITQAGQVSFKHAYGMSNLEYNIPVTTESIFHIASESKKYTAFCLLLLQQQGKLSIDDVIRKYLPYVPDFGKKITIRHLINQTSGLRDQWQLLTNAGWQMDDVITQDHIVRLVSRQKQLNFMPGDDYMYSNTGYTLLAEIVKQVSGLALRDYADRYVFQPLGMSHTHFHDNYLELVKDRTYSYAPDGNGGFQHEVLNYSTVGATSLLTTVEDETKWMLNYKRAAVGGKELIEMMFEKTRLNDGREIAYAFGLIVNEYKGYKRIGHSGSDAGFRSYTCWFPEEDLGITLFSNHGSVNPVALAMKVADLILPVRKGAEGNKIPLMDSALMNRLTGNYISELGDHIRLKRDKDNLQMFYGHQQAGTLISLVSAGNNRYTLPSGSAMVVKATHGSDSIQEFTIEGAIERTRFVRRIKADYNLTTLKQLTGEFYNDETESYYSIVLRDNQLRLRHRKFSEVPVIPVAKDQFSTGHWWMSNIKFLRDKWGRVTGFEVNCDRIMHMLYRKIG